MDKDETTSRGERRGNVNNIDIAFPFGVLVAAGRPTSMFGINSISFA